MIDWKAIKTEYITTGASYRELAAKYGVSRNQIGNVGKAEKWVEERRRHLDSVVTKTVAAVEDAQARRASKLLSVADKLLGRIEAAVDGDRPMDVRSVRALAAAIKDLKEIQGIRTELEEQEQKARIAALRQKAAGSGGEENDETGVILLPEVIADG